MTEPESVSSKRLTPRGQVKVLDFGLATVKREWALARSWLFRELSK